MLWNESNSNLNRLAENFIMMATKWEAQKRRFLFFRVYPRDQGRRFKATQHRASESLFKGVKQVAEDEAISSSHVLVVEHSWQLRSGWPSPRSKFYETFFQVSFSTRCSSACPYLNDRNDVYHSCLVHVLRIGLWNRPLLVLFCFCFAGKIMAFNFETQSTVRYILQYLRQVT